MVTPRFLRSGHLFAIVFLPGFLLAQLSLNVVAMVSSDESCSSSKDITCEVGMCCSTHGWCGNTSDYCASGNCAFQCWISPGAAPIASTAVTNSSSSSSSLGPSPHPRPSKSKGGISVVAEVGVIVGGAVGFILIIVVACYCYRHSSTCTASSDAEITPHRDIEKAPFRCVGMSAAAHQGGNSVHKVRGIQFTRVFSIDEVKEITNDYEERIGAGGFGCVFKGIIHGGKQVAVKVSSETSEEGRIQFDAEVSILSKIQHTSLVQLIGLCEESNERILVYDFVENGTLRDHLFDRDRKKNAALDWSTRIQIAIDAARGLDYLHNECKPKIIHRDVKSNNIMLDNDMRAKLIDFGISKLHKDTEVGLVTTVKGTSGYLDPEYKRTNHLTFKSDVYAFGVVLMEIISGQSPMLNIFGDDNLCHETLVSLFRHMSAQNKLEELVDRELGKDYNKKAMEQITALAMRCVNPESRRRPKVREVFEELKAIKMSCGVSILSSDLHTSMSDPWCQTLKL